MTEFVATLLKLTPYAIVVSLGLALVKVTGAFDLSWWQVTAPLWGAYIVIVAVFGAILTAIVILERLAARLTARRERGKLETSA